MPPTTPTKSASRGSRTGLPGKHDPPIIDHVRLLALASRIRVNLNSLRQDSQFALFGVPVLFEIDDQLVAEMTERLLEGICRQGSTERFQRLRLLTDRLAGRARAHHAGSDRTFDEPRDHPA